MKLFMFRTFRLSIISSLFIVHPAMVYVIQVCRQLSSRTRMELVLFCCWWVLIGWSLGGREKEKSMLAFVKLLGHLSWGLSPFVRVYFE
jgi:hypothetical protein